jgi:hypothetical protein
MTKPLCDTCLVIVAMDCLTKFAKVWALKTSIKECVVWFFYERMSSELELLLKWFLIVCFKSWVIFVGYLAIKHSITTPYMHSANGLVKHWFWVEGLGFNIEMLILGIKFRIDLGKDVMAYWVKYVVTLDLSLWHEWLRKMSWDLYTLLQV